MSNKSRMSGKYMENVSNKSMYDVIVIGAGSGGLNVAGFMNKAGFSVLLIDKDEQSIGGDCLNFGCVPSKALLHAAKVVREGKQAEAFGVSQAGAVDIQKVMRYISDKQDMIREHENADYFREQGMDVALGTASFTDMRTVRVDEEEYTGKKIVVATGSRPRELDIPGSEDVENLYTNETIFSMSQLPRELVIAGTGPIGVEIGQAFNALGSNVTMVGTEFLNKEDLDIAGVLQKQLENEGIRFVLGKRATRIENGDTLIAVGKDGEEISVAFDAVLAAIGRVVTTDGLNLGAAGVETDERGRIISNERLQTSNRDVFVCGDVAGQHMFTHAAELHASVIINNFFSPFPKKLNTDSMAWVTYTDPEIATFGLSPDELDQRAVSYEIVEKDFTDDDRAIVDEYTNGKAKIYVSKKGVILGGTIVARHAGELAQELILAQTHKMKTSDLSKKVYPYPTASRINRSLALDFEGKKLNPFTKKVLQWFFH